MLRIRVRLCSLFVVATVLNPSIEAYQTENIQVEANQPVAAPPEIYQLLPNSVQAAVWVADCTDLTNRWHRTTLHQLSNDPAIRPFFTEQQEIIQNRLMDAGWRLGVKPQDLADYFRGQLAVAWLELEVPRKPFALIMVADIEDDEAINQRMLSEIDAALAPHAPGKKILSHLNQQIVQYTMAKRPGQLLAESTFLAISAGKLLVSDELFLVQELMSKLDGQEIPGKPLAEDPDFIESRQNLKVAGSAQIEYFVRPLGIARVIRAISGRRSKSSADILAVLKNQGFTAIKCISGEIWLAEGESDIAHRGFVLADLPLPRSAAILDFPNESMTEVPSFVTSRASSFLATTWNVQTAFWKARDLVDELVGNEGVFDEVIHGIKNDVNGPQVDIKNELLPLMTNDIVAITDCQEGEVQVNSRRNLIGVKVNDHRKAAQILDRVMKAEANAELLEINGVAVWKVNNEKDTIDPDEFAEFGDFEDPTEEEGDKPWLNQWAICVLSDSESEGYFLFASHVEMLEEAIAQAKSDGLSSLRNEADYQRINTAIMQLMDSENPCAWKISRNHLAFRVQYELFRQGKLDDSESMLSSLLERMMGSDENATESSEPIIRGDSLPPFEAVAKYLNPSGFKIMATDSGWEFGGLMLGAQQESADELTDSYELGTARIVDSTTESKR